MHHHLLLACSLSAAVTASAATPDGLLTSKAKLSLWTAPGLGSAGVRVDTNDGVVTLHGTLASAAQRGLASKLVLSLDGVRGVQNLLRVGPARDARAPRASDRELGELARARLGAATGLVGSTVSVTTVEQGVVWLGGQARSWGAHLAAVAIVDRIPGVVRVVSQISVPRGFHEDERAILRRERAGGAVGGDVADARLTMQVKRRLLVAAQVPSGEVRVDTDDGVVTLFGIVPAMSVRAAAGAEAAKVSGVRAVHNHLEVAAQRAMNTGQPRDTDVTRELALAFDGRLALARVSASVRQGVVELSGAVPDGWAELEVLRLTRGVRGVRAVQNHLAVDEPALAARD